jgi:hypothetical protein
MTLYNKDTADRLAVSRTLPGPYFKRQLSLIAFHSAPPHVVGATIIHKIKIDNLSGKKSPHITRIYLFNFKITCLEFAAKLPERTQINFGYKF